jgi:hypothetical protein
MPEPLLDNFRRACRYNAQTPSDAMRALMRAYALDAARKAERAASAAPTDDLLDAMPRAEPALTDSDRHARSSP